MQLQIVAGILAATIAVAGCGAESAPDPFCTRLGTFSVMLIEAPGFGTSYGDALPLLVDVCPRFLECETFRVRPVVERAEPIDCLAEPGTTNWRCELDADGTLQMDFELPYPVDWLQGEREVRVTLRTEDGTPFAENAERVLFEAQYRRGEACGQSHAIARLELDADGWLGLP
jgi:hypothetical protein